MNRSSMFGALAVGILLLALALGNPFLPSPARARPADQAPQADGLVAQPASMQAQSVARPVARPVAPVALRMSDASARRDEESNGHGATPADLPDPDQIGPCPRPGIAVVRRGIDPLDGRPTWWHADGSMTKRIQQTVRSADDEILGELPGYVTLRPR